MNIAYIVSIISVLLLMVFAVLSFIKAQNLRFQLIYIVVACINIGVLTSIIIINYSSKSALVWPGLLLLQVVSKAREIYKAL